MQWKLYTVFMFAVISGMVTCNAETSGLLKRIIGGKESKENEWPWLVNILILDKNTNMYKHKCGGTLIDAEWVLTAAHCLAFNSDGTYLIRLGEHDQNDQSGNEVDHTVDYAHIHPRFITETQFAYDIALIKIKPAASFSQYVNTVGLPPTFEQVPVGKKCLVAGWGQMTTESRDKSNVVQHVKIPIVSYEKCAAVNNAFPYSNVSRFSNICGGDVDTDHSPCNGDSGGPLVCKNSAGKYVLQGIVSWGDEYCRSHFYGVFTRVSSFINWIDDTKKAPPPQLDRDCGKDYHYFCEEWYNMNYCGLKYIQWNCPKTCGVVCSVEV